MHNRIKKNVALEMVEAMKAKIDCDVPVDALELIRRMGYGIEFTNDHDSSFKEEGGSVRFMISDSHGGQEHKNVIAAVALGMYLSGGDEKIAKAFAMELLLPDDEFIKSFNELTDGRSIDIEKLAEKFNVPLDLIIRRIKENYSVTMGGIPV